MGNLLFIASLRTATDSPERNKTRAVYVVAANMFQAVEKLKEKTSENDELIDIKLVSEECYV